MPYSNPFDELDEVNEPESAPSFPELPAAPAIKALPAAIAPPTISTRPSNIKAKATVAPPLASNRQKTVMISALAIAVVAISALAVIDSNLLLKLVGIGGDSKVSATTTTSTVAKPPAKPKPKAVTPNHSPTHQSIIISVPKIIGLSSQRALAKLSADGFRAQIISKPSLQNQGIVISSSPAPGARVHRGILISVTASNGIRPTIPPRVIRFNGYSIKFIPGTAPNLNSLPRKVAAIFAKRLGYRFLVIRFRISRRIDRVVSQTPEPGQVIKPHSTIRVTVTRAPLPKKTQASCQASHSQGSNR